MEKLGAQKDSCRACESTNSAKGGRSKSSPHPDHSASLKRLNRIKGQLGAVGRMIEQRNYCVDIVQQIRAAESALRGLEAEVLRRHLRGCVSMAFASKNSFEANDMIEEILDLWNK
jgi:CsoR family transcriptional regulator, copper-sensing transcriptional repressor